MTDEESSSTGIQPGDEDPVGPPAVPPGAPAIAVEELAPDGDGKDGPVSGVPTGTEGQEMSAPGTHPGSTRVGAPSPKTRIRPPRCWCGRATRLGPGGNRFCPTCGNYHGRKAPMPDPKKLPAKKFKSSWWEDTKKWAILKMRKVRG